MPGPALTYLLIDGENLDATLGGSVLQRRPEPAERPRWDRVRDFATGAFGQPARPLFFLNATHHLPTSFVAALLAMDVRPVPLSGGAEEKVVDVAILRTLNAIAEHGGDVLLASHDGDFLPAVTRLLEDPDRRVGVLAFREFLNGGFAELERERGLRVFDLEDDARAFQAPLPRVRVIPLDRFDPLTLLG